MGSKNAAFSLLCDFLEEEEEELLLEKEEKKFIEEYREESLLKISDKILPKSFSDIELASFENKHAKNHNFRRQTHERGLNKREYSFDQERLYYISVWVYQSFFKGFLDIKNNKHYPVVEEYNKRYYLKDIPWMGERVNNILKETNETIFTLKENWEAQSLYWMIKRLERARNSIINAPKKGIKKKRRKLYTDKKNRVFIQKPEAIRLQYFRNMQSTIPDIKCTHGYIGQIRTWKFLWPAIISKLVEMKCIKIEDRTGNRSVKKHKVQIFYPRLRYYMWQDGKKYDRQKRFPGFEILVNDEVYNFDFDKWKGFPGWDKHIKKWENGSLKKNYYRNEKHNFLLED